MEQCNPVGFLLNFSLNFFTIYMEMTRELYFFVTAIIMGVHENIQ